MVKTIFMMGIASVVGLACAAQAQTWETDPAFGAKRNAYGPGVHMDATGRPYRDSASGGGAILEPVRPNVYGPGVGMDATGRPVRPKYNTDTFDSSTDDD